LVTTRSAPTTPETPGVGVGLIDAGDEEGTFPNISIVTMMGV
jgi:hypothetical protein